MTRNHTSALRGLHLIFIALFVGACVSDATERAPLCEDQALIDVEIAEEEGYLGLSDAQMNAVAYLAGTVDGDPGHCSGVWVAPRHLLTAEHCLPLIEAADGVVMTVAAPRALSSATVSIHPEGRDLALLEFAEPVSDVIEPLPVWQDAESLTEGSWAVAAGYGRTRRWMPGLRHFTVQEIASAGPETIAVQGLGERGVCAGDSGGPLLARDADGLVRVLGVLSTGAANCSGRGTFARVDAASTEGQGALGADEQSCGALTEQGRCFGEVAAWCDNGAIKANPCQTCGWSVQSSAFRCLEGVEDACAGVSSLGTCDGEVAVRCEGGRLVERDCAACDQVCVVGPGAGVATCVWPPG